MNNNMISFRRMPPRKRVMVRSYPSDFSYHQRGMEGLGKSFFKKIFSSPKELKKRIQPKVKRMIPTPKKIKSRMQVGLKLMKVALKPSGAKMLAKKGGLKTALTKPEQFLEQHKAKKAEMARKKAEAQQEAAAPAETPQEQAAYATIDAAVAADNEAYANPTRENIQRAMETALAAAAAIRSAGLGDEAAASWEEAAKMYQDYLTELDRMEEAPPVSPIEEETPPYYPETQYDIPSEPAPYYPEEYYGNGYYYPEEYYASDEYYYPYYEEENLYADYNDYGREIIPGTEWYYEMEERAIGKPPSWEYESSKSDSITPTADWYREYNPLPYDWSYESNYYYPDYQEMQYESQYYEPQENYYYSDYMYGKDYALSGLGRKMKRKRRMEKKYIPMRPRPINPSFTQLTKTYKYEPDSITQVPFPVSRIVKSNGRAKRNF